MKRQLLYKLSILLLIFGCSDFLDQEPDVQVSINEQLSTRDGVLQAYNGAYVSIEDIFSSRFAVYADALGGNLAFTPAILGDPTVTIPDEILFSYNFNANPQELDFDNYYDNWYDVVNQANLILSRLDTYSFFSNSELNQLQAELLTIRALAHYQVSLLFAQHYGFTPDASHLGVVYNTNILTAGEDFPFRQTMAETYDLIKTDLDTALGLYESVQLQSGPDFSYFNFISTSALYARIALQMNDWQVAKEFATTVITESGVSLIGQADYISAWEYNGGVLEMDQNGEEVLVIFPLSEIIMEFSAPTTSEGNVSSTIAENFQFSFLNDMGANYADYVASGDLLALYEPSDIRQDLFLEVEIPTLANSVETDIPYFFTKKFQGDAGTLFIRLSEMYLVRAEANARLGLQNEALSDLNSIRTRVNLSPLATTNNVLDDIFIERRRELAFEGHLLFDIARFQKNIERNLGCIASLCSLSYPSNFFILPIPEDNVLQNENMEQNDGY